MYVLDTAALWLLHRTAVASLLDRALKRLSEPPLDNFGPQTYHILLATDLVWAIQCSSALPPHPTFILSWKWAQLYRARNAAGFVAPVHNCNAKSILHRIFSAFSDKKAGLCDAYVVSVFVWLREGNTECLWTDFVEILAFLQGQGNWIDHWRRFPEGQGTVHPGKNGSGGYTNIDVPKVSVCYVHLCIWCFDIML